MFKRPTLPARAVTTTVTPPTNVLLPFKRLGRHSNARLPLSPASPIVTTLARSGRLRHLRAHAAAGIDTTGDTRLENADGEEDDDDDDGEFDEFIPPPLPTSALELLSQVLTGIAAANYASPPFNPNAIDGTDAASSSPGSSYQPLRFCVNCCRPLSAPGAACGSCGHDPRRNTEVLGDPTAWVEAYAAQLQRQDEQALLLAQQKQQQHEVGAASASGAAPAVAATTRPAARGPVATAEVLLAADARTLLHRSSLPPYPGRPERLQAIMSRLHSGGLLEQCRLLACRPATDPELLSVHSAPLVEAVRGMGGGRCCGGCGSSGGGDGGSGSSGSGTVTSSSSGAAQASPSPLCADTLFNAHTATAALLAAGAAADLGLALASGRARSAMAIMRPPGAQAGIDVARGGCYLNNVAIAASAALSSGEGIQRVMIVDWDVHHGRGTQEIFANDPRVMVVSMHRYDSETYPGSGAVEEVGEGEAEGTTLNVAFGASGSGGRGGGGGLVDGDLLSATLHVVLPVAYQFRPQMVLVAAGFGALKGDPIGGCSCSPTVFAHLTHLLSGVAPRGIGLLLEGGYNLSATSEAVEGCLRVLLGETPPPLSGPWGSTSEGWVAIMNAMQIHSHYWSSLHPLSFHGWTSAIANQKRQLQQQKEERQRAQQLALEEQREEDEFLRLMQQQKDRQQAQQHLQQEHRGGLQSGAAAAGGGWASAGLRDDDLYGDEGDALVEDGDDNDDGLSAEELARVAAALQRAQESWGLTREGGGGEEMELAEHHELADPRDIDPAELLDLFLGTGGSEDGRAAGGGGSRSSSSGGRGEA